MHDPEQPMPEATAKRSWLESLSRYRRQSAAGLLAAGLTLAVITVFRLISHLRQPEVATWAEIIFTFLMGSSLLGVGLWHYLRPPGDQLTEMEATRLLVLAVGGLTGLAVTVLGISLAFRWWDTFSAGLEVWRTGWWRIAACLLSLFGGMVLMFFSLQLARPEERSSVALRRLLYGYNAVLTGFLLLAILLVVNVLVYVRLPFSRPLAFLQPFEDALTLPGDWTESNIFTLSTASRNLLASLEKPVKLYILLPQMTRLSIEVKNLTNDCTAINHQIEVENVSPDSRKAGELMRKYELPELVGVLVVYGTEPHEEHEFITVDELRDPGSDKFVFKGENVLLNKLISLTEGKSRAVVYLTQGHGELDINDPSSQVPDRGLGVLKERLQKANYDVKELRLDDPTLGRIPANADIVVMARPARPLSETALKALRSYMNPSEKDGKRGKLIVLLDVVTGRDGNMVQTGLEKFLEEYNLKVNNDRILILPNNLTRYPLEIFAVINRLSRNPLATAFADRPFFFTEVRTVEPKSPDFNSRMNRFSAETLFLAPDRITLLEKPPLQADPTGYVQGLLKDIAKNEDRRRELEGMLSTKPLSVAVVVSEPKTPSLSDGSRMQPGKQEPRLIVFGDASWVANGEISRANSGNFELMASCLSWLREHAEMGKMADDKQRKFFSPNVTPEAMIRLQWLPGVLICIAILGLGGGIWIVRRR